MSSVTSGMSRMTITPRNKRGLTLDIGTSISSPEPQPKFANRPELGLTPKRPVVIGTERPAILGSERPMVWGSQRPHLNYQSPRFSSSPPSLLFEDSSPLQSVPTSSSLRHEWTSSPFASYNTGPSFNPNAVYSPYTSFNPNPEYQLNTRFNPRADFTPNAAFNGINESASSSLRHEWNSSPLTTYNTSNTRFDSNVQNLPSTRFNSHAQNTPSAAFNPILDESGKYRNEIADTPEPDPYSTPPTSTVNGALSRRGSQVPLGPGGLPRANNPFAIRGPGSHTFSRTWTSFEEKEWQIWLKARGALTRFARHSPFVPVNYQEWLQQRLDYKLIQGHRLMQKVDARLTARYAGEVINALVPKNYGVSAALHQETIWRVDYEFVPGMSANWPSLKEFAWEGDERQASDYRRFLPLPRVPSNSTVAWHHANVVKIFELDQMRRVEDIGAMHNPIEIASGPMVEQYLVGKDLWEEISLQE
ncbi:MAG: hypothetical protein M1814_006933 [Vezdaea aestivalis]|nr:MAG: hypothetical protein M1814_006933 [Vezdaea aestivalis]